MNSIASNTTVYKGKIHPKLFLLYISFGSMIMLFSAFCSALIVRKGDIRQAWLDIPLPSVFLYSTLIIVISSLTIHLAYRFIASKPKFMVWSLLTLVLSLAFVYLQWYGWNELQMKKIFLNGNPAGSFIYVISGLHGVHYIGGITALVLMILNFRKNEVRVHQKMGFNILMQYWHFIGLVWVLLYLFFKFIIYN